MLKQDKPDFVKNLSETLKTASAVVLVDYSKLSVILQQDLSKRLKKVGCKLMIVKNTLFKLAVNSTELDKNLASDEALTGQTAIVMTEGDPVMPLQIVYKFAKEFELPQFKVGVVDGNFYGKEELLKLSKLPGKEALQAQVVGAIASPLYGIVGVTQANIQKLLYILKSKSSAVA